MAIKEQLKDISHGEENREAKTHLNRSEPSPNAIKTQVIHTTGQVLIFPPLF